MEQTGGEGQNDSQQAIRWLHFIRSISTTSISMIRLGTRGSKLAMWQSQWVKAELERGGQAVELVTIKTEGDVAPGPLSQIGGQGLFTKRLQQALQNDEVDLAVHSLKDLPTEDAEGLQIAAIPHRETPLDTLVSNTAASIEDLPQGAIVGTGSVRRAAQLLHHRPDLDIRDIRGNVDTRLRKLDEGQFEAIVLAAAGLTRLGWQERIRQILPADVMLPAVGQGALGLEIRSNDAATHAAVELLNHPDSFAAAMAERWMLRTMFAGCLAPVGARTEIANGSLTLTGVVLSRDGRERIEGAQTLPTKDHIALGKAVAEQLIEKGAGRLLQDARDA